MKLYVWNDPYAVSYGASCLYVVASSEDEARQVARTARRSNYGGDPDDANLLPDDLGPPTRVIDAPCAEIYEWSE